MKLNKIIKITIAFLFFLCMSVPAFAQSQTEEVPEDEDLEEAPLDPAPIGDYLLPMLVLGVATAFVLLRKRNTAKV